MRAGQRRHRARRRRVPLGRRISSASPASAESTWWSSGPRRRSSRGSSTSSPTPASPPSGRRREAARIEGSKAYAKQLMKDTGVPTASHVLFRTREEAAEHLACASYPAVLKADVLAAGKGVIIAADEREARAGARRLLRRAALRRDRGGARGVPRGRGALAARALRRRARRPARPGAGLQAHLRRRRGPEHGRDGELLARAGLRRRARAGAGRARPPADRRRAAPARHALPRRALRGPDDGPVGTEGARVQRALRRPGDAGRPAAAALRPARPARGLDAGRRARGRRARSGRTTGR